MPPVPDAKPAPTEPLEPVADTCGQAFNNAWVCYDPKWQSLQYYRYGVLDTCNGRWEAIWACMDRNKRGGQGLSTKAPLDLGKPNMRQPYWNLMDPEESAKKWRESFKHMVPTEE
eukprot:CAMPEP_0197593596 /NCGR_PEP_ID=MMETSP1326-20131121/18553_1 /TAXON_ID=1155430 /ORGANISM="Genus nov. species nov., Strain RCC2288" /LENGTH=114 /DNA_ID=CAMNT_0043159599 /DNA_START=232 /DNA_END=573 /DNA_ORIENTATION=-